MGNPTFWLLGLDIGLVAAGTYSYATERWPAGVTVGFGARIERGDWRRPLSSRAEPESFSVRRLDGVL